MPRRAPFSSSALGRVTLGIALSTVAWLVVLAHLASTLHFALISHEICAAHGELLHRASASGEHPSQHPAGTALLPGGADAEHDHCPVVGRRHDQVALVAPTPVEIAPAVILHAPSGSEGASVEPSRALLLLTAPKQSPPA
jgi:hypothetical protein